MEGTYDVVLGGQTMGRVTVRKQGLYWQFDCQCNLSGEVMFDLIACVGQQREKLGLLTPEQGRYTLRTQLPAKRLGEGTPAFLLQPRHSCMKDRFVPVRPDEPFAYIHRLEDTYLAIFDGQVGLVLPSEK